MITAKTVRLPDGLWAALEVGAKGDLRSVNRFIHFILEGYLRGLGLYPTSGEEPRVKHEVWENEVEEPLPAGGLVRVYTGRGVEAPYGEAVPPPWTGGEARSAEQGGGDEQV